MMKSISKILGLVGLCAGVIGVASSAKAWTAVPVPGAYGTYGATVTDFWFADSVSARARKQASPDRSNLDVTANVGAYTSSLSIWCTTGNSTKNQAGTNTTNGDISLTCASGGLLTSAGGALQAN